LVAGLLAAAVSSHAAYTTVSTSGSWDGNPPGTLSTVMQSLLGDTGYNVNASANRIADTGAGVTDQTWSINQSATTALLLEIAGYRNQNVFGIYNLNTMATFQIFPGTDSGVTTRTVYFNNGNVSLDQTTWFAAGNTFGFYLDTPGPTFYSRESDNGGRDQMVTLTTSINRTLNMNASGLGGWANTTTPSVSWNRDEYLLGWEDLSVTGGDRDYQDMLIKVSAIPVPEPTTILAGALLLLPFAASTIRRFRKNS
jgi:hypothetical protein